MSWLTYIMIFAIIVIIVIAISIVHAYWRDELIDEHKAQRDRLLREADIAVAKRPHVKSFSTPMGKP